MWSYRYYRITNRITIRPLCNFPRIRHVCCVILYFFFYNLKSRHQRIATGAIAAVAMAEVKDWRPFVYGGLASITAEFGKYAMLRLCYKQRQQINIGVNKHWSHVHAHVYFYAGTFPIDTTKTRLQIQGQKIDQSFSQLRYRGMTDAFVKISREEGLRALYSG